MHRLLRLLLLAPLAACASEPAPRPPERGGARPNIVLVMSDDMGYSDVGCFGGEIDTPNLDRLAANGLRFTQFTNAGRCCPTRASLMTGLYAHQAGIGHMMGDWGVPSYRGNLAPGAVTLAEVLRSAGYRTGMSGKWHLTRDIWPGLGPDDLTGKENWPLQRGFEHFFGTIHAAGSFWDPITLTRGNAVAEPFGDNWYYTDAITDFAERTIRRWAREDPDSPFFLYVAYTAPHWPLHALERDIERYRGRYDGGWDAVREARLERMLEMGLLDEDWPLPPRDRFAPAWEDAGYHEYRARCMEVYAAQLDSLDQGVGRILEALEESGDLENTLFLFLGDNGASAEEITAYWGGLHIPPLTRDMRRVKVGNDPLTMPGPDDTYQSYGLEWANASNTPFREYKSWVHEGGVATPLIAHWPEGIAARGELRRTAGHVIDLMPTFVELAGASYPELAGDHPVTPMEGASLVRQFDGDRERPAPIFYEHEGNRAVRKGRWKLVSAWTPIGSPWELYDMVEDRAETRDLAREHPEVVAELEEEYEAWAERCGVEDWPFEYR